MPRQRPNHAATPPAAATAESLPRDAAVVALQALQHELHNVLTPVAGLAQLALASKADRSLAELALRRASESAQLAVDTCQVVLAAFATAPELTLAAGAWDAAELAREVVERRREVVPRRMFHVEHDGAAEVVADRVAVGLALTNLVLNAEAASPIETAITIRVRGPQAAGGTIEIAVIDAGPGIPAAKLPYVAQEAGQSPARATATSYNRRRGDKPSGLGLMICRRLMAAVGGRVSIRSQVGQGTTVTLAIPSAAGERSRAA